jgi:hypothetical protein
VTGAGTGTGGASGEEAAAAAAPAMVETKQHGEWEGRTARGREGECRAVKWSARMRGLRQGPEKRREEQSDCNTKPTPREGKGKEGGPRPATP